MKQTSLLPLAAACFAASLAPSCIHWNTGTALRESSSIHTGVDVLHPSGGRLYRVGKGAGAAYYMQAPEVTYTPRHRCVYYNDIIDQKYGIDMGEELIAADIHRTGRMRWVRVTGYPRPDDYAGAGWRFAQEVPGLPAGAKLVRTGETFNHTPMAEQFGTLSSRKSGWKGVNRVLSYPAEYVADPVMWALSNTGVAVTAAAMVPVGIVSIVGMPVAMTQLNHSDKSSPQREAIRKNAVHLFVKRRGTSFVYTLNAGTSRFSTPTKVQDDLSAIELAEVMDKGKPYLLIIRSSLSKAECNRAVAELRAQGFNVVAMEKDGKTISLSAK